jgi:glycine/D-amino acid oxidase-like deaminating enzyme
MTEGKLLPVANRTESFWLTERDPELKAARTTPNLPSSADVVIVGSGMSGAMMAYHLTRKSQAQGKQLNIVMLEADECCGSATARNGKSTSDRADLRRPLQASSLYWLPSSSRKARRPGRQ